MALSFLYQLVRRFLLLVRVHRVGTLSKDAEIIVLSKTSVAGILRDFVADLEEARATIPILLRDRDTEFTTSFDVVMASVGIGVVRTPVMAPAANAFAERWVRTVRQECLDHLLVVSRRQLEAVIRKYVRHYNRPAPIVASTWRCPSRARVRAVVERSRAPISSAASSTSTSALPEGLGFGRAGRSPPRHAVDGTAVTSENVVVTGTRRSRRPAAPTIPASGRKARPYSNGISPQTAPNRLLGPFRSNAIDKPSLPSVRPVQDATELAAQGPPTPLGRTQARAGRAPTASAASVAHQ